MLDPLLHLITMCVFSRVIEINASNNNKINKMVVASLRVTKLPVAYFEYQVYSGAQIDGAVS